MPERHVLFFAYHFPPENQIGAQRPYRFYKYLNRLGYQCHVITAAADVASRPDLNAQHLADPFVTGPRHGIGWQWERLIRRTLLPGVIGVQWSDRAYRAGLRFVQEHRRDQVTIFSTSPPLGPHLAAWRLARTAHLPWIADYRDPLARNPAYAQLGWQTNWTYQFLEKSFVRHAAYTVANTDEAERLLKERHPGQADKIHLIWNGFDPEERVTALPVPRRDRRVYCHVGELYEGRNATPLLDSMARLRSSGRLTADAFQIQLIGPATPACLPDPAFSAAAEREGWLKIIPDQIAKAEAQQIAQTSDGLLLIQPHSKVQVPGKLFDYLQIGRPILAFVPRHSSIERVLQQSEANYRCVYAESSPEEFDCAVLSFFSLDPETRPTNAWFETTFDGSSQAALLANLIENGWRERS